MFPILERNLRSLWRGLRRAVFRRHISERTIFGSKFRIAINDPIAASWYGFDRSLFPSFKFLTEQPKFRAYRTIYYLGAHQCVLPIGLVRLAHEEARIIAVEADRHNCRVAAKNLALNGETRITIVNVAISDRHGSVEFAGRVMSEPNPRFPSSRVEAMTIDALAEQFGPPDLLIIDIEGFELKALRGAQRTLANRPDWCVEVHIGCGLEAAGGSLAEVVKCFSHEHYDLYRSQEHGEAPTVRYEPQAVEKEYFELLAIANGRPTAS